MEPGYIIDNRYQICEVAGEGGMATVYRGLVRGAEGFTREVGIKVIRREFGAMKNYVDMFIEEARIGSDLAHPNIVQVQDFLQHDGGFVIIMDWVDGADVASIEDYFAVQRRPVPWFIVCEVAMGVLRGLSAAHERHKANGESAPVIHRDISPTNIMVDHNGTAKLTDFGLARARDRVASLTAPGTVKGKLWYLAPETAWGQVATALSDIFGVGIVMWEFLSGRRLFDAPTDVEVFGRVRQCEVPALARADLPAGLEDLIRKALAKKPEARFASAREFAVALQAILWRTAYMEDIQLRVADAVARSKGMHSSDRMGTKEFNPLA